MKKIIFIILAVMLPAFLVYFLFWPKSIGEITPIDINTNGQSVATKTQNSPEQTVATLTPGTAVNTATSVIAISDFLPPLASSRDRVTKKPFGIYITPKSSPVQPEKFTGYHTGVDFEIFPDELKKTVNIKAVCTGRLRLKEYASGYGGVAIQDCQLDNQLLTVIYGHLKLASIVNKAGDNLPAGAVIGVLGAAYSQETDGERQHLHLGFHKGSLVNIRGYVSTKSELFGWLDPCLYVCEN